MESLNYGASLAAAMPKQRKSLQNLRIEKIENGYLISWEGWTPEKGYQANRCYAETLEGLPQMIKEIEAEYSESNQ